VHPAFSVIIFTVAAGAGYGLAALLAIAHLTSVFGTLPVTECLWLGGLALVLISVGLVSSSFHLANPKNAWRAFSRFRTSWLSREAVLAVITYPVILAYLLSLWTWQGEKTGLVILLGSLVVLCSLATIFTTGMIYACLKTIRQWHTALTPANYIALGVMLGGLLLTAVQGIENVMLAGTALVVVLLAAILKAIYFFWIGRPSGSSINTATGFNRATVRLLDVGHSAGTFLTDEFGYHVASLRLWWLRVLMFVLSFILPALVLSLALIGQVSAFAVYTVVVLAFVGVVLERWLFFAEARHVVGLYHGAQRT